jgi:hypothetical protein
MTTAPKPTVLDKLAREVLRKLRLVRTCDAIVHPCSNHHCPGHLGKRLTAPAMQAVEAEEKEDREIICSEVFSDITCELDGHAKGRAAAQHHMPCMPVLRHTACTPTRTHPAVQASWTHTMRGCTSRSLRHTSTGCGWHSVEQFVWDRFLWRVRTQDSD